MDGQYPQLRGYEKIQISEKYESKVYSSQPKKIK